MIEHGSSIAALGLELLLALATATLLSWVVAGWAWPLFLAVVMVAVALVLPASAACLILGRVAGTAALGLVLLPVMAWGWRRLPARQWRTARALGGSPLLIARVLVMPSLAPFLLVAILLGVAILSVRWRLDSHPAPLMLPDPTTATG